jgi:hypothetical protein
MEAANTQPNRALAQAVNSRITADAVMLNAKSTVWRLIGVGAMCGLIGLGVGAAFFGYSYIHDPRTSAQKMAQAFAEALEKTTLTTTGEVKLDPQAAVKLDTKGAQVQVDPTSTVRLDASGSVVRLDPNAVVNVRGVSPEVPRPTPVQLNPNTVPGSRWANVVTNYTVFKYVTYGKAQVVTGWVFNSNEDLSPRSEYCYYSETIQDGVSARIELARDGRALKGGSPPNVDRTSAAANCVWFGGGSTRSY